MHTSRRRKYVAGFIVGAVLISSSPVSVQAATIVRAVYKGGLDLEEQPAGTTLADASVCLPSNQGTERYDYAGQLVKTVEKANTRMSALIIDQKISSYTTSIALIDRNLALLSGTLKRLTNLEGVSAYLLPLGAAGLDKYPGAKFEGKCSKLPGAESFGHPDAFGALVPNFGVAKLFAESAPWMNNVLTKEMPQLLKQFAALDANKALTEKQRKEETKKLADGIMEKANSFIVADTVTAAEIMPREFGARGTRIASTPTISIVSTTAVKCKLLTPLAITVNAVSASHTFNKCLPEYMARKMIGSKIKERQNLLTADRATFAKLLLEAGKERAALEKMKPQYFGD